MPKTNKILTNNYDNIINSSVAVRNLINVNKHRDIIIKTPFFDVLNTIILIYAH